MAVGRGGKGRSGSCTCLLHDVRADVLFGLGGALVAAVQEARM